MKSFCLVIISLVLINLVAGCGPRNNGAKPPNDGAQLPGKPDRTQNDQADPSSTVIVQGVPYISNCQISTDKKANLNFPRSQVVYIQKDDLTFDRKQLFFTTDDCRTESVIVEETGTIDPIGRSVALPAAFDKDFNFVETIVKITNPIVKTAFNNTKMCGFSDWEINVEKDVSDRDLQWPCLAGISPRTERKLVLVENFQLFFGENKDPNNVATRPINVDRTTGFVKKQ